MTPRPILSINSTSIPVAGIGGIGMIAIAAIIGVEFPIARFITVVGGLAGVVAGVVLIRLRRRQADRAVTKATAMIVLVAALLYPRAASAMEISMFDDMAVQDQRDYLTYLLKNAEKVLIDLNRQDQSTKLHELFSMIPPDDHRSVGEIRFQEILGRIRAYVPPPNAFGFTFTVRVETALMQTLYMNGVELPHEFDTKLVELARTKPYWPKHPLRTH